MCMYVCMYTYTYTYMYNLTFLAETNEIKEKVTLATSVISLCIYNTTSKIEATSGRCQLLQVRT